jgi:CRP-like cAMP-binding protein
MEMYDYRDEKVEGMVDPKLKRDLISKQPLFSLLNDDEITVLMTLFKEKKFKKGETIVTEGDPVDNVFLIISGTADVRHVSVVNSKLKIDSIAQLEAGSAIGLNETGFYSLSGRRTATVVALTDMILLELSVPAFHGFALSNSRVSSIMRNNTASE